VVQLNLLKMHLAGLLQTSTNLIAWYVCLYNIYIHVVYIYTCSIYIYM
jgi:hypothetical protein